MSQAPCIITAAITGSVPRKENNPAVPITVSEQIESTHACYEAGAALVHVHVRNDDGSASSSPEKFAAFQEGGVFNAAIAQRFLDAILSRGGSRDALEAFIDFRGRKPDIAPLLRQFGIAA